MRALRVVDETTFADQVGEILAGSRGPVLPVHAASSLDMPAQEYDSSLPSVVPDIVQLVVKTSGSTGHPKLVAHSVDSLHAAVEGSAVALGGTATDSGRWILALPAHYIAGVLVLARAYTAGHAAVQMPSEHFDAAAFLHLAAAQEDLPLYTSLVPVQLQRLVNAVRNDEAMQRAVQRFRSVLVGGQRLDVTLRAEAEQLGIPVVTTYGASETAGGCCYDGYPIGDTTVRIDDDRILIGGSSVALGYLDRQGTLDDRDGFTEINGERYYRSQDRGVIDAAGRVKVLGRVDTVINRGGLKLDLSEVEEWMTSRLDAPCVLIPCDDSEWGQGYVVVTPATTAMSSDVMQELVETFGKHARPQHVLVQNIPVLPSGKPDRYQLSNLVAGLTDSSSGSA